MTHASLGADRFCPPYRGYRLLTPFGHMLLSSASCTYERNQPEPEESLSHGARTAPKNARAHRYQILELILEPVKGR